jgi:hypothetical protein
MLIGLRFLLLFVVLGCAVTFLSYLFTKNPRFLKITGTIVKISAVALVLIVALYALERGIFV